MIYVLAVAAAGFASALYAALRLPSADPASAAALFALLAAVFGTSTIPVPATGVRLNADTPFLVALVILGAGREAVLLSGLSMALACYRSRVGQVRPHAALFNLSTGFVGGLGAVFVHALAMAVHAPAVLAAMAAAAGSWSLNTAAVAGAIRVKSGSLPGRDWKDGVLVSGLAYLASGTLAYLLARIPSALVQALAVAPVGALIWHAYRSHRERAEERIGRARDRDEVFLPAIQAISAAIEARDPQTHGHNQRVGSSALEAARELGITDENVLTALRYGALLHDIGKIAVPDAILHAPRRLSEEEMARVRRHAVIGSDLVRHVSFPPGTVEAVRHHHERWDGGGYPDGLVGERIPLLARVIAACDCLDDLTAGVSRGERLSLPDALRRLSAESGHAFDPAVVAALVRARAADLAVACPEEPRGWADAAEQIATASREQAAAHGLAYRDELTGLGNGRALRRRLEGAVLGHVSVLMMDLDGFKGINDHYGHELGDVALRLAGAALGALETSERVAFRNGGDEFVVVLRDGDPLQRDRHVVEVRAALEAVRIPVSEGRWIPMRVSIGAATGASDAELLKQADAEMYLDKQRRRSGTPRGARPEVVEEGIPILLDQAR